MVATKSDWQDAKSSMIRSFRYVQETDADNDGVAFGRIEIIWGNGSKGAYLDVNRRTYEDFLASESRGKFLNSQIKANFKYEKTIDSGTVVEPSQQERSDTRESS